MGEFLHLQFCRLSIVIAVIFTTLVVVISGYGQPGGASGARAGSVSASRVAERRGTIVLPEAVKYRTAIKRLGLNEDFLVSHYRDGVDNGLRLKLRDIIIGYLVGREITSLENVPERMEQILIVMEDQKQRFRRAFESVFALPKEDSSRLFRKAESALERAMK